MKNSKKTMTADEIANLADQGEDISKHFTNNGAIRHPIQRVNVDFPLDMLSELDSMAKNMNISRQALIKMTLRQYLDNHYLALSKVV